MKELIKKWQFWLIVTLIAIFIVLTIICVTLLNKNDEEDDDDDDDKVKTSTSSTTISAKAKSNADSAEGIARDALTTALASISTKYYVDNYNGAVFDYITAERIEKEMNQYDGQYSKFKIKKDDDYIVLTFSDGTYIYKAKITEHFTINDWEMK